MTEGTNEQAESAPVHAIVHTPGPWRYHGGWGQCVTSDRGLICECRNGSHHYDVCEQNARLIAAAPSMKKLIEELYDAIQRGVGPMAGASDGEIGEMINDEMSNLFGNNWRSVV